MSNVRPFLTKEQLALWTRERDLPRARAKSIARRSHTADLIDEMEGAGNEGLCMAARAYSPVVGTAFRPFAQVVVDRSILQYVRKELRHRKLRVAGYVLTAWGAAQVAPRSGDILDVMEDAEDAALEKMRSYLDPKLLAGALALSLDAERYADDPALRTDTQLLCDSLKSEIATWEEPDQRLFTAVYGEDMTVELAGAEVGLSAGSARARHRSLLLRLRKLLNVDSTRGSAAVR